MDVREETELLSYLSFPMKNLSFNLEYSVRIFAKDRFKEGPIHDFLFRTPSSMFNLSMNRKIDSMTTFYKITINSLPQIQIPSSRKIISIGIEYQHFYQNQKCGSPMCGKLF